MYDNKGLRANYGTAEAAPAATDCIPCGQGLRNRYGQKEETQVLTHVEFDDGVTVETTFTPAADTEAVLVDEPQPEEADDNIVQTGNGIRFANIAVTFNVNDDLTDVAGFSQRLADIFNSTVTEALDEAKGALGFVSLNVTVGTVESAAIIQ